MNVVKKIVFCTLLMVGSYICPAQEVSVRSGFNLSQMLIKWDGRVTPKNAKLMPGFQIGSVIDFPINNLLSFETGLLYSTKGLKEIGDRTVDQRSLFRLNIAYLDIPLTIKISHQFRDVTFLANGGGYIAQGLFGNILSKEDINSSEGTWQKVIWGDQANSFRRLDFGLNFGLGMKYKAIQFGICYEKGIANLAGSNRNISKVHNRSAEFYLSYLLWNKSKTKN